MLGVVIALKQRQWDLLEAGDTVGAGELQDNLRRFFGGDFILAVEALQRAQRHERVAS